MYSMCAGVCSSLVPSLGGGGMSLWLYASGEVWLFVCFLVCGVMFCLRATCLRARHSRNEYERMRSCIVSWVVVTAIVLCNVDCVLFRGEIDL